MAADHSNEQRSIDTGKGIRTKLVLRCHGLNQRLGAAAGKIGIHHTGSALQGDRCPAVFIGVGCHITLEHIPGQRCQGVGKGRLGRDGILHYGIVNAGDVVFYHRHYGIGIDIHAEGGGNGLLINGNQILKAQLGALILGTEFPAGKHIHIGTVPLAGDDGRFGGGFDDMPGKVSGIGYSRRQCGSGYTILGAHNANHLQSFAPADQFLHIGRISGHVLPDLVGAVIAVPAGSGDQLEFQSHQLVIGPLQDLRGLLRFDSLHHLSDHIRQFFRVLKANGIGNIIGNLVGIRQNHHQFQIIFRPTAPKDIVLRIQHIQIAGHFLEHVRVHIGGHGAAAGKLTEEGSRVDLEDAVRGIRGKK